MIKNVAINETGISINGRKAIDQSLKNKKMMTISNNQEEDLLLLTTKRFTVLVVTRKMTWEMHALQHVM